MHCLVILSINKKLLNLHDNIFEVKVDFESNFNLDPIVRQKGLDKINELR
jgi:hypothetical protein